MGGRDALPTTWHGGDGLVGARGLVPVQKMNARTRSAEARQKDGCVRACSRGLVRILRLACALTVAAAVRGDTLRERTVEAGAPGRYAALTPSFSVAKETFLFTHDNTSQTFWCVKDGSRYIAVLHEGMAQLDMITFDPAQAAERPAFQSFYSWGTLLGTRILVSAWVGEMRPTGKVTYAFTGGGSTLTLNTEQVWSGRKGSCRYELKLRLDPVTGYVWDMRTVYDTDQPVVRTVRRDNHDVVELERPQFFNWQVRVTKWAPRHGNPRWPAAWTHERTIFQRLDGRFVGFYNNAEAVDRSRFRRTEVMEGGFVAKGPDSNGWGVALCHLKKTGYSTPNATCNMWADSHNLLKFKKQPDADGLYRVSAEWRFQAVPPEVLQAVLKDTEMDTTGR